MFNFRSMGLFLFLGAIFFGGAGCEREGPAEEAGEDIDRAMDDSREAVEEAIQDTDERLKDGERSDGRARDRER